MQIHSSLWTLELKVRMVPEKSNELNAGAIFTGVESRYFPFDGERQKIVRGGIA
jgi:hypothetical protein